MENENKSWRLSVQLTPEQAKELIELRKQDEYCRLSYGELLRRLVNAGLEATGVNSHDP
jgi:Na+-translocating ferredoxin:NAD+ oxidoreductase RnfC subunit